MWESAEDGEELTFAATNRARGCWPPDGTLYWDGPDKQGRPAAATASDGPFTYEVLLVLEGVRYQAIAHWPADEIPGNEPSVALDFTPVLPALQ